MTEPKYKTLEELVQDISQHIALPKGHVLTIAHKVAKETVKAIIPSTNEWDITDSYKQGLYHSSMDIKNKAKQWLGEK